MALDIRNLYIRSASGAVYVGLIIGGIICGPVYLAAVMSLFALAASYELESNILGKKENSRWLFTWSLDAAMLFALIWSPALSQGIFDGACLTLWLVLLMARFIVQIFADQPDPAKSISVAVFSQCYIGVPLALFVASLSFVSNPWIIVCAIAMIWINDTGAYLVGCTLGRHRMYPRLSPKKSWEGFLGGIFFNIAVSFVYFYCFKLDSYNIISNVQGWIFIGICVSAMATLGDLFESMMKRSLGIKDFGRIIPGHGGVLDRIDSLLFVVPGVMLLIGLASDMFL